MAGNDTMDPNPVADGYPLLYLSEHPVGAANDSIVKWNRLSRPGWLSSHILLALGGALTPVTQGGSRKA
jgi:hypothetical protein